MTRKSLSITQEQLSEGICSVETLSRVENGKQNPSRDTYELLMERMGRSRERYYSMMSISDYGILEKMKQLEDCLNLYDYIQAEKILNEIKETIIITNLNRQYLIRAETVINFRLKRINADEFLRNLEKAILLTIPQYGKISSSGWPLTFYEAGLLLNISSAYAQNGNYIKAIEILEDVKNVTEHSYMDKLQRVIIETTYYSNLSKWYGVIGEYKKAIEVAEDAIMICKEYKLGHVLPNLFYGIAWNMEQLIDKGVLPQERKKECLIYLKRAYYAANTMQQLVIEKFLLEHIQTIYSDISIEQILY
jgi:tetratricopeptide (TPR) repeat protein